MATRTYRTELDGRLDFDNMTMEEVVQYARNHPGSRTLGPLI